jgi:hypothetical protein
MSKIPLDKFKRVHAPKGPALREHLRQKRLANRLEKGLSAWYTAPSAMRTSALWTKLFPTLELHERAVRLLVPGALVHWPVCHEPRRPVPKRHEPMARFPDAPVPAGEWEAAMSSGEPVDCRLSHRERMERGVHRCLAHGTFLVLPGRCLDCPSPKGLAWWARLLKRLVRR